MSFTTRFIDKSTGLLRTGEGVVTGREVLEASAYVRSLPMITAVTHVLIDFTRATAFESSSDEIKAIAASATTSSQLVPKLYMAIAASRDADYGLSRMYQVYMNVPGWIVQVFRTRDEARTWLMSVVPGLAVMADEEPAIDVT